MLMCSGPRQHGLTRSLENFRAGTRDEDKVIKVFFFVLGLTDWKVCAANASYQCPGPGSRTKTDWLPVIFRGLCDAIPPSSNLQGPDRRFQGCPALHLANWVTEGGKGFRELVLPPPHAVAATQLRLPGGIVSGLQRSLNR